MAKSAAPAPYVFKPHERPFMPGSPASPDHPTRRRVFYFLIGVFLAIVSGFQNGLLIANLATLQGNMALTPSEAGWVTVAYNMTNACMSILMFKARREFGIQRFVRVCMAALLLANFVQLFDAGYRLELIARGISGIAASGLSTLAMFYIMQALSGPAKIAGMVIAIGLTQVALPLARAISPMLVNDGNIIHLFELQFALSLIAFGMVNLLQLPPGDTTRSFEKLDLLTFPLLATGIGLLCAFLVQGRIIWWETPWLGYALAGSILLIGLAFLIEHNRSNPMLHTRWMTSKEVAMFALTGALVRVLLSEQNFGASGLFSAVGMVNDQLVNFYWVMAGATLAGTLLSVVGLNPMDLTRPVLVSLGLIVIAAFLDTSSGIQSRPVNLYFTQAVLSFAAVYFMGPTMMEGLLRALSKGPAYIVSFSAIFGLSQTLGGLAGVAILSAFHTVRVKAHLMTMGNDLSMSHPAVAQTINQIASAYTGTISDPALRTATGVSRLIQQAAQQATILAFNDVFFVIGCAASFFFLLIFARWLYHRRMGINPLAKELQALQALRAQATDE